MMRTSEKEVFMRHLFTVTAFSLLIGSVLVPPPLAAKTISIAGNSASELKKKCEGKGVFFPPNKGSDGKDNPDSPYACLGDNGSIVVCGGGTDQQKKTCDVARIAPAVGKNIGGRGMKRSKRG